MTCLDVHPKAVAELIAAVAWYEKRRTGLGKLFLSEVEGCMQRIVSTPALWPVHVGNVRRCLLRQFPFAVLFIHENCHVYILAVMHLRRRPGYWEKRGKNWTH